MDTRTKKQKAAVGRLEAAAAKKLAAADKARLEAIDMEAFEEAKLTAAAWVAAIRLKVAELVYEAGRLDNLSGHPDSTAGALILRCVLSPAAVSKFIDAAYALEELLGDDMFAGDCEPLVPDLAGACRRAGESSTALYKAEVEKAARAKKPAK